jgi:hypothetical protein
MTYAKLFLVFKSTFIMSQNFNIRYLILFILFNTIYSFTLSQDIPSPDIFLGYSLGSRLTIHSRIVDYFRRLPFRHHKF